MKNLNKSFVLGVDLDGCVADYFAGFRDYVADIKGIPPEHLGIPIAYDFVSDPMWSTVIKDRDEFLQLHGEAVDAGLFLTLNVFKSASRVLWELSDKEVYIRIITHRLHNKGRYSLAIETTARWLEMNMIPYRGISFERYKAEVGCDLYLDDSPHNVTELRAAGKDCIIYDAPYNKEIPGLRAYDWQDVEDIVEERLSDRGY